jgi:transcriptional regulator with XRE-family HTH domain
LRVKRKMTVSELADATGVSIGMLSKIENGLTSPSLTTIQSLAYALQVPLTTFFKRFEETRSAMHVKAGEGIEVERVGTRSGHQYSLLGHIPGNFSGVTVEPYLIVLTDKSDKFPAFQHEGIEFIYMLEGCVDYRHADKNYRLNPGDCLFFDADAPHGPDESITLPVKFLSVISYQQAATATPGA